jgi:hypothetical protein
MLLLALAVLVTAPARLQQVLPVEAVERANYIITLQLAVVVELPRPTKLTPQIAIIQTLVQPVVPVVVPVARTLL